MSMFVYRYTLKRIGVEKLLTEYLLVNLTINPPPPKKASNGAFWSSNTEIVFLSLQYATFLFHIFVYSAVEVYGNWDCLISLFKIKLS